MTTGERIKELRIKKGLTQEELAARTELSVRTIQRIENGEVDPRSFTLQMIAKALDVEFSVFIESENINEDEMQKENDKTSLALLHLSGLFLLIFPTFLFWKYNLKSDIKAKNHFNDIIKFQTSMWLIFIIPGLIIITTIHLPYIIYSGLVFSAFFTILNAIRVLNDKPYKYLMTIKLQDKNGKTKINFN